MAQRRITGEGVLSQDILVDSRSENQSTGGLGAAGFQAGDDVVLRQLDRLSGVTPGQLTHRHFVA